MQSDAVVINIPRCINRTMQMLVSLMLIEFELISLHVSTVQYYRHNLSRIWDKNIGVVIHRSH